MKKIFSLNLVAVFAATLLMTLFIASCSSDDSPYTHKVEAVYIELSPATKAMANNLGPAYVKYTTDVIKYTLSRKEECPNLAISPLSATMLMALIANGVEETSKKEITDYLGIDDIDTLNELCRSLLRGLPKADAHVDIDLANSVWVNKWLGLSLNKQYESVLGNFFDGEYFNFDFHDNNKAFLKALNKWYAKNTDGLISDPGQTFDPDGNYTVALLLNALCFKAPWNFFPEENTKNAVFHGVAYEEIVDMMTSDELKNRFYYKDENFEVINIDFANSAYWFHVVLPSENLSLEEAVDLFTPEFVECVKNEEVRCDITVSIPKFTIKSRIPLNPMLAANGMSGFMDGKNMTMFNSILGDDVTTDVWQNTFFSIDEKGVKVAEVSSAHTAPTSNMVKPGAKINFTVDRPFLFYIVERSTQSWIASGYVANIE